MKLMPLTVVALILFVLAGCAATVWEKPGWTESEFRKDDYECEKDSRQSDHYGNGISGALVMRDFYRKCMMSKGWTISAKPGAN